jgi:predicted nucleic acid-binding protein
MLVDTSVWVDHLRRGNRRLATLLENAEVECHPFVIGELACGGLSRRTEILPLLAALPQLPVADHDEVLHFVEAHGIAGCGIGWVDAHLLCSVLLSGGRLWTLDRRLAAVARRLGVAVPP